MALVTLICLYVCFVLVLLDPTLTHAESLAFQRLTVSNTDLRAPHDLALSPDGRHLYVSDNGNNRIAVLHPYTLEANLSFGEDELDRPHDMAFDRNGHLLVADTGNNRIAIYKPVYRGARLVGQLDARLKLPESVAVHQDGRVLSTGSGSGNMVAYLDGRVIAEAEGLSAPHDVVVNSRGDIWVADAGNDRLVRFDQELRISAILSGLPYVLKGPRFFDIDSRDRMYVAEKYSNQIKIIDPEGTVLAVLGAARSGAEGDLFDRPEGIEIVDDNIWIADTYNDRVVHYRVSIHRP